MLEGLVQAYIEAFGRGWAPRCELARRVQGSRARRAEFSTAENTGIGTCNADHAELRHLAAADPCPKYTPPIRDVA